MSNKTRFVYIVIPTINGEINGDPLLYSFCPDLLFECTLYIIDLYLMTIEEIDV